MSKRMYVLQKEGGEFFAVGATQRPKNAVGEADDQSVKAGTIMVEEDYTNEFNQPAKRFVRDVTADDARIAARAQEVTDKAAAKQALRDSFKPLKIKLLGFSKGDLDTVDKLEDAFLDLRDAVAALESRLFNIDIT